MGWQKNEGRKKERRKSWQKKIKEEEEYLSSHFSVR
jgi:hypothetical protein